MGRDIAHDDRAAAHDGVITDRHPWHNDGACTYKATIADAHVTMTAIDKVMRQHRRTER
jgi:hypothetical protein